MAMTFAIFPNPELITGKYLSAKPLNFYLLTWLHISWISVFSVMHRSDNE